jgi:hypothetical protein
MLTRISFGIVIAVFGLILVFSKYLPLQIFGTIILVCVLGYLGWVIWSSHKAWNRFTQQQSWNKHMRNNFRNYK